MNFNIGLIQTDKNIIIRNFDLITPTTPKLVSIDDIKSEKLDLIIWDNSKNQNDLLALLEEENKFYPISDAKTFDLNENTFNELSYQAAKDIIKKSYSIWTLDNNLRSIENIANTLKRLEELWPNDRIDFFEELWFIIKKNLGASNLKLIFNHIKINDKPHQKNQLVQFRIDGQRLPSPHVGDDFEKDLMENYKTQTEDSFNITEYDRNQGQLVICGSIKESPVIIMAELFDFTGIQKSLLKSIFNGLQLQMPQQN